MKCPKCNLQLPDDSEFCQYCGAKIQAVPCEEETNYIYEEANVSRQSIGSLRNAEGQPIGSTGDATSEQIQPNDSSANNYQPVFSVPATIPLNSNQAPVTNHKSGTAVKDASDEKDNYCKRCGGKIDKTTKKCTSCGKQYFRAKVLIMVVLSVLVLGFAGLNVFQYISNQSNIAKIEQLENSLSEKDKTISTKDATIASQKSTISTQKTKISSLEREIDELEEENLNYFWDLIFYETYAAIVPDDGTKMYHTHSCEELGDESFWIYNINAAEDYGYYPCPNCH